MTETTDRIKHLLTTRCNMVFLGISGAGKSTFAKYVAQSPDQILSSDKIREMLSGSESDQSVSRDAFEILGRIFDVRTTKGCASIVDATNLHKRDRTPYIKPGTPTYLIVFPAGAEEAKANQMRRDRQVPDHVVDKHAVTMASQDFRGEGWREVIYLTPQDVLDAVYGPSM